jgi:UDP-N-acetylmuramoyl-L-alanyl-D-glutamate--2,6-diaminopimelate ligase
MLWAEWYGNPAQNIKTIGITGTNGKTSVSYMIKKILDEAGYKTALFGTIKSIIGGVEYESKLTTSDPDDLARLFSVARDAGVEYAVMEVSSHALELEKTAGLGDFEIGIFTNLTQDHLDFHGTMENYSNAKAKLFKKSRTGILNADDEAGRNMLNVNDVHDKNDKIKNYFYGKSKQADFYADDIKYRGADGIEYDLCVNDKNIENNGNIRKFKIKSPTVGEFYVYNTLAAAVCGIILEINDKIISDALSKVKIPGRMEKLETGTPYSVFIDYAHTPDALESVLKSARGFSSSKIICVFGCGGDRDRLKRPEMGRIASQNSDFCIVTSDNSRTEEPAEIIKDIIAGIDSKSAYETVIDRREAIGSAISIASPGDIVLLAGKGHEEYIDEKGEIRHFSEREVVFDILNNN